MQNNNNKKIQVSKQEKHVGKQEHTYPHNICCFIHVPAALIQVTVPGVSGFRIQTTRVDGSCGLGLFTL